MMNPDFTKKRSLRICETKVDAQKIDSSKLDIFGIVIALFSIEDKEEKSRFFEEIFLLADISMDITVRMFFYILSNVEVDFVGCYIYWKTYIILNILLIRRCIERI